MNNDSSHAVVTTIQDLKRVRHIALCVAVFACGVGFLACVAELVGMQFEAADWLHQFSTALAWTSLLAITTTIGVMFLVWMPVHDQIVASLRVTRDRRLKRSRYVEAFISAPQGRSSPPPRHRHR